MAAGYDNIISITSVYNLEILKQLKVSEKICVQIKVIYSKFSGGKVSSIACLTELSLPFFKFFFFFCIICETFQNIYYFLQLIYLICKEVVSAERNKFLRAAQM